MTPSVEKIISDYINSPTGTIRSIYPVIDHIDFEYHETNNALSNVLTKQWVSLNVYLNSPIDMVEDLWDTHNFDWTYMMDYHITKGVFKMLGIKKLPYDLKIYAPRDEEDYNNMLRGSSPEDSKWKYIEGTGGLQW